MKQTTLLKKMAVPLALTAFSAVSLNAHAALVDVKVTIENLAPTNTLAFAPLRLGFHNGSFDSFDIGSPASSAIISIAEGGSGSDWFPAFAAADPTAVLGTVAAGGPAVTSGNAGINNGFTSTASNTFRVNTSENAFFSFANMVVPSNDLFLANDEPLQLFDANGNLQITQIFQTIGSIWDANSEVADLSAAAFVVGGNNGARTAENGLVAFDYSELAVFDGLSTPAGYQFDFGALNANSPIYSISFEANTVPVSAPATIAMFGLASLGFALRRKKLKLK